MNLVKLLIAVQHPRRLKKSLCLRICWHGMVPPCERAMFPTPEARRLRQILPLPLLAVIFNRLWSSVQDSSTGLETSGGFPNSGVPFCGPGTEDFCILGSTLTSLCLLFGKFTLSTPCVQKTWTTFHQAGDPHLNPGSIVIQIRLAARCFFLTNLWAALVSSFCKLVVMKVLDNSGSP